MCKHITGYLQSDINNSGTIAFRFLMLITSETSEALFHDIYLNIEN